MKPFSLALDKGENKYTCPSQFLSPSLHLFPGGLCSGITDQVLRFRKQLRVGAKLGYRQEKKAKRRMQEKQAAEEFSFEEAVWNSDWRASPQGCLSRCGRSGIYLFVRTCARKVCPLIPAVWYLLFGVGILISHFKFLKNLSILLPAYLMNSLFNFKPQSTLKMKHSTTCRAHLQSVTVLVTHQAQTVLQVPPGARSHMPPSHPSNSHRAQETQASFLFTEQFIELPHLAGLWPFWPGQVSVWLQLLGCSHCPGRGTRSRRTQATQL